MKISMSKNRAVIYFSRPGIGRYAVEENPEEPSDKLRAAISAAFETFWKTYNELERILADNCETYNARYAELTEDRNAFKLAMESCQEDVLRFHTSLEETEVQRDALLADKERLREQTKNQAGLIDELRRESIDLLRRGQKACTRQGWETGESTDEWYFAAGQHASQLEIEIEHERSLDAARKPVSQEPK